MDINNLILNHSLNVPIEEREKIYNISWVVNFRTSPNAEDLRYLFSIWNSYLSKGETEDINCSGCRAKVVSKLRRMSYLWKENGLIASTIDKK